MNGQVAINNDDDEKVGVVDEKYSEKINQVIPNPKAIDRQTELGRESFSQIDPNHFHSPWQHSQRARVQWSTGDNFQKIVENALNDKEFQEMQDLSSSNPQYAERIRKRILNSNKAELDKVVLSTFNELNPSLAYWVERDLNRWGNGEFGQARTLAFTKILFKEAQEELFRQLTPTYTQLLTGKAEKYLLSNLLQRKKDYQDAKESMEQELMRYYNQHPEAMQKRSADRQVTGIISKYFRNLDYGDGGLYGGMRTQPHEAYDNIHAQAISRYVAKLDSQQRAKLDPNYREPVSGNRKIAIGTGIGMLTMMGIDRIRAISQVQPLQREIFNLNQQNSILSLENLNQAIQLSTRENPKYSGLNVALLQTQGHLPDAMTGNWFTLPERLPFQAPISPAYVDGLLASELEFQTTGWGDRSNEIAQRDVVEDLSSQRQSVPAFQSSDLDVNSFQGLYIDPKMDRYIPKYLPITDEGGLFQRLQDIVGKKSKILMTQDQLDDIVIQTVSTYNQLKANGMWDQAEQEQKLVGQAFSSLANIAVGFQETFEGAYQGGLIGGAKSAGNAIYETFFTPSKRKEKTSAVNWALQSINYLLNSERTAMKEAAQFLIDSKRYEQALTRQLRKLRFATYSNAYQLASSTLRFVSTKVRQWGGQFREPSKAALEAFQTFRLYWTGVWDTSATPEVRDIRLLSLLLSDANYKDHAINSLLQKVYESDDYTPGDVSEMLELFYKQGEAPLRRAMVALGVDRRKAFDLVDAFKKSLETWGMYGREIYLTQKKFSEETEIGIPLRGTQLEIYNLLQNVQSESERKSVFEYYYGGHIRYGPTFAPEKYEPVKQALRNIILAVDRNFMSYSVTAETTKHLY